MQIKNVKVAFLEESIIRSGYPMQVGEPETLDLYDGDDKQVYFLGDGKRAKKLANYQSNPANQTQYLSNYKA